MQHGVLFDKMLAWSAEFIMHSWQKANFSVHVSVTWQLSHQASSLDHWIELTSFT